MASTKIEEMQALVDKVMQTCKVAKTVTEERHLKQLLKQIVGDTAEYMTK